MIISVTRPRFIPICRRLCIGFVREVYCRWELGCVAAHAFALLCLCCQVEDEREAIMTEIEEMAASFRSRGKCADWLAGADPLIAKASHVYALLVLCHAV